MVRRALCLAAVVLPQPLKRALYRSFGWEIHQTARVGLSYLQADFVGLAEGASIGHFNIVRNLRSFTMGRDSYILNFNKLYADSRQDHWERTFSLGELSRIMSSHFFDVAGRITIGRDCNIGGRDTQMWSHSRFSGHGVDTRDLTIEDDVYIGARATIVHCTIPRSSVVAAGAVVTRSLDAPEMIIAGNPAEPIRHRAAAAAARAAGEDQAAATES